MNALDRIITGGEARRAEPPISRSEEVDETEQQFEPLPGPGVPTTPPPREEEVVTTETDITYPTPISNNVEYMGSYYTEGRNGGNYPVYGRWRVDNPELGDVQDLIDTQPDATNLTILIFGSMVVYAGISMGKDAASFVVDTNQLQTLIDDHIAYDIDNPVDLFNEYLVDGGYSFESISSLQVVNYEDRPG
jgi:hypothetical protein